MSLLSSFAHMLTDGTFSYAKRPRFYRRLAQLV